MSTESPDPPSPDADGPFPAPTRRTFIATTTAVASGTLLAGPLKPPRSRAASP
ncbi:twin-arginine translocation signal domain-containing protein [Streptomyces sp. LBUM 1476]|nr:twin-arginine translocation signal domain-containing protein [Streptomyces sp. LBUM 1476]